MSLQHDLDADAWTAWLARSFDPSVSVEDLGDSESTLFGN